MTIGAIQINSDKSFEEAKILFEKLQNEYIKEPCDIESCLNLLQKLKLIIPFFKSAPPNPKLLIPEELIISRETLEYGALLAVRSNDNSSFERYIMQLFAYYHDFSKIIPQSPRQYAIIGMYLIHLLACNMIGDFHMMLEMIPAADRENSYLKYAILLEQNLMDGNYYEVLVAYRNVPDPMYTFFMDSLTSTVRLKVAASLEKAYDSVDCSYAVQLLLLDSEKDLVLFATSENERKSLEAEGEVEITWSVQGDRLVFIRTEKQKTGISAIEMIDNIIGYATELERII